MLEKIGDEGVVPDLIEALITMHAVPVKVVDTSDRYSFATDGSFGPPAGSVALPPDVAGKLATGQYPNGVIVIPPAGTGARVQTVMVDRPHENAEVLQALQAITREDFGFDKPAWRRWWSTHLAGVPRPARRP
jgi:hypothetical protein